jgi:NAD(P)-dependent dehydrogenase (short-subunit alcohol dehydrogenase family)
MSYSPDLTGKTALVTGGGKGIGRALSIGLAKAGADVVVASRTQADLESVSEEIRALGRSALPRVTDLTAPGAVEGLIEATVAHSGGLDILVNNAARSFMRPLMDLREDGFDKIFSTNVKATFLLSRAAAKIMMGRGGGHIVNVTTVGAERGGPFMGAYFASKAAVKMLTQCMAVEWAPFNIHVNAVGPGMTKTDFSRPIWSNPDLERQIVSRIPQGRLGEPDDIVGAVLFLCSEGSRYINGQSIYVDGGGLANG